MMIKYGNLQTSFPDQENLLKDKGGKNNWKSLEFFSNFVFQLHL